jgi:hypothetical protein
VRHFPALPALLVVACPAQAQVPCGPNAGVTVHPEVCMPGQVVTVTLTNTSNQTLQQNSGCVYGNVMTGASCSGTTVKHRLCTTEIVTIGPGESEVDYWLAVDDYGQPLPAGTYSMSVDYSVLFGQPAGCCVSVTVTADPPVTSYCTAGVSSGGCTPRMNSAGVASAGAASGFFLEAWWADQGVDGLFFFGTGGRQANPWGNGSSYQCVVPPVKRTGLTKSSRPYPFPVCAGTFSRDLNAVWTARPNKNPGAGAVVQAQLWYRDTLNTSNQTTSLSDAHEFTVGP